MLVLFGRSAECSPTNELNYFHPLTSMSYILGSVVQQTGPSTTVTVCQAAKIKFYTDVVFPKI